jgi:enamine deaminase RidA (YjgF/YER057c/UK114 family)
MSADVRYLSPAGLSTPTGYSHVVAASGGTTVYISGQVAFDAAGSVVGEGDYRRQAEQVFANLQQALAFVGAEFEHLVKVTYFVVGLTHDVTVMLREVRAGYLSAEHPPASTLVAVAGLVDPRLLIEIEAIAVIP